MRKYTNIKGFSLIELMIVIAIIGILASVAVPSYQKYVLKAKLADLLSAASSVQLAVSEYTQTTGSNNCSNMNGVDFDTRVYSYNSNLIDQIIVDASCNITVQGIASQFAGASPLMYDNPAFGSDGSISWSCTMNSDVTYAPNSCPAEIASS